MSFSDTSILVCTTFASASLLPTGNQHQGTRVTSPTVAVPEVTWFPDVVFAKEVFCLLSFKSLSSWNFVLEVLFTFEVLPLQYQ